MGNYKDISFLGDCFSVSFSADHIHLNGFCLSATKKPFFTTRSQTHPCLKWQVHGLIFDTCFHDLRFTPSTDYLIYLGIEKCGHSPCGSNFSSLGIGISICITHFEGQRHIIHAVYGFSVKKQHIEPRKASNNIFPPSFHHRKNRNSPRTNLAWINFGL